MFVQQHTSQMRERSSSRSKGSIGSEASSTRTTRERSSSASSSRDPFTKRSSIFSKRPKSILTTASNDSSTRSIGSNSSGSDLSHLSPAGDALTTATEEERSKARFHFGRGLKNRMSGIRAFPGAHDFQRTSSDQRQSAVGSELRISAPFGFQHVSKAEDAQSIRVDSSEVFQNFRTLSKRHRHAVIASTLEEEEGTASTSEPSARPRKPAPLRPRRPDDLWSTEPATAPLPQRPELYLSANYMDSHSQPRSADFRGALNQPPIPKRSSSAVSHSFFGSPASTFGVPSSTSLSEHMYEQDPFVPLYDSQPPGWIENSLPLLHTVSPVDTSDTMRTPAFQPPLEQVPEEPEGTFSARPSKDLPRRPSLRHSKSTPVIAKRSRSSIDPFVDDFPMPVLSNASQRPISQCSQGSDTLGNSPGSFWHEAKAKVKTRSLDLGSPKNSSEPTWEDYIEYCYEHNAEADCEFNWQETSHFDDNDSEASESWSEQYSPFGNSRLQRLGDSRSMRSTTSHAMSHLSEKSDRVTSHSSVPELDYRFSRATSTASLSIATPRDGSLYRVSDVPPLPTELQNMKDAWGTHLATGDHLYNEIMVGRTAVVPDSPQHPDDKAQTMLYTATDHHSKALPTPPSSGSIPHEFQFRPAHKKASKNHSSQAVETREKEPRISEESEHMMAPIVAPRRDQWPLEDNLQAPTPPESPTAGEIDGVRSFLFTPFPEMIAKPKPSPLDGRRSSTKLHISFPSIDLPPLTLPTSTPVPSNFSRIRAGSVADRIGPLPPASAPLEKSGTPDSASSAPEGLGRMGYSLFPSKKTSTTSLTGPPLPTPPTSMPLTMSEPSLTRPVSRAASQASSSKSSSRALSFKSKSSSKKNAYQERFPLGI